MKRKIAVPTDINGMLENHFGQCSFFEIFETNGKQIISEEKVVPPPHEPGSLPLWLANNGVTDVLAGGIGERASNILTQKNINVFKGSPDFPAKELVENFICGTLEFNPADCDHHHEHDHHHQHHHHHNRFRLDT